MPDFFPFWGEKKRFTGQLKEPSGEAHAISQNGMGIVRFIRISGAIIAAIAATASGANLFEWFIRLRPLPLALMMTVVITGSSVLLPDFAFLLAKRRGGFYVVGAVILFLGCLAVGTNMVGTVAALYNSRDQAAVQSDEEAALSASASERKTYLLDEKKRLENEIARLNEQISATQKNMMEMGADKQLSEIAQVQARRLVSYNKEKGEYEKRLETVVSDYQQALSIRPIRGRNDFFAFFGVVFGVSGVSVEFWLSALPALFLDLIAPLMMALSLFLDGSYQPPAKPDNRNNSRKRQFNL